MIRSDSLTPVAKAYRKAMLKIHPDKHVGSDWTAHQRATEMFKAVTDLSPSTNSNKRVGRDH
jgi:DnaJ-class molecular chaperone